MPFEQHKRIRRAFVGICRRNNPVLSRDVNAQLIYSYLERKGIPRQDIPKKLDAFTMEFENVVGFGRGQILGAAQILEEAILKAFCAKLKIAYTEAGSRYFPDQIRRLKETCGNGSLKRG